ncbi:MAG: prephenate dehydrogenase [Oscillospiraceae bacterium]|nr:prephenate dehydrogenase [Oscillospiraceae bacterium]
MTIGIVGLGLIGGSLAMAIRKKTAHHVLGTDTQDAVVLRAQLFEAIHGELSDDTLKDCDVVFLALYPKDAMEYVRNRAPLFKKGGLVVDCCGVKGAICPELFAIAKAQGFNFVGGHPMAGIEYSGFTHAHSTLFEGASMILVPDGGGDIELLEKLKKLCIEIGFAKVPIITAKEHDRVIAYTSQLAHIVSSAYVKCPHAKKDDLSAGSFKDMTRVARLNSDMWTELFLLNRDPLLGELEGLIDRLAQYAAALRGKDEKALWDLLEEGNRIKVGL